MSKLRKLGMVMAAILVSAGVIGKLNTPSGASTAEIYQEKSLEVGQTISVVGDMGTGTKVQYAVADSIKKSNPTLIKTVGDNIYEKGFKKPTDKDFVEKFLNPYSPLNVPFEIVLGNHDWYSGDPIKAWKAASEKYPWIKWRGNFYAVQRGKICELHLDTEIFDNPGLRFRKWAPFLKSPASEEQLEWLKKVMPQLQERCSVIIGYGHHPYLNPGKSHGDASGDWKEIFEELLLGKVYIYIAGHEHILADEGSYKGTRFLISGAGGKIEDGFYRNPAVWGMDKPGHLDITMTATNQFVAKFIYLDESMQRKEGSFITVNFKL